MYCSRRTPHSRNRLASITVPTLTDSAHLGPALTLLPKNQEFVIIVSSVNVLTLVLLTKQLPGSLKAICPLLLIPQINKAIPPTAFILDS